MQEQTPVSPVNFSAIEHAILRDLVNQIPDLVFAKDRKCRFVYHNIVCAQNLTGDPSADLTGTTDFDYFPHELAAQFYAEEQDIIRTGQSIFHREQKSVNAAGEVKWSLVSKLPWHSEGGKVIGIIGIYRDITKRKNAEETLAQRNREMELVYEAGRLISRSLDVNTVYDTLYQLVVNIMECDSLIVSSFSAEEQLIRAEYVRIQDTRLDTREFPPIPLEPEGHGTQSLAIRNGKSLLIGNFLEQLRNTQTNYNFDENGLFDGEVKEDEEDRSRSVLVVPMLLESRVIGVIQVFSNRFNAYTHEHLRMLEALAAQVAVASTNAMLYKKAQAEIAERRQAEQAMRALAEENARLAAARSNLLQEVNHRAKNNLTSILGLLEMEINRPAAERSDVPALLRTIQERILGMAYVHNLLSSVQWTPLRMKDLVTHIITAVLNNASLREKIKLSVNVIPEDIQIVPRQATALALIINELSMNSVKHAFAGKKQGNIAVNVTINGREEPSVVTLTYQDDGGGFPQTVLEGVRKSVGMDIIHLSVQSPLGGKIRFENDGGAKAILQFRLAAAVRAQDKQ